jgi:hypothetical protein
VVEDTVMLRALASTASESRSFGSRPSRDGRPRADVPGAGARGPITRRANHAQRGQGRVASGA